jgi:hypothetical protein
MIIIMMMIVKREKGRGQTRQSEISTNELRLLRYLSILGF